jgi:crotonobetainyl-CoA:carnitine CoA-transferase CaiB-like acyl-CoA transferase
MLLADAGAEVIRIEPPGGGEDRKWALTGPDGETLTFKILARNKKGITLALNSDRGNQLFKRLVRCCDIVLHNFAPGTRMADELDYSILSKINPRVIVATVSGYGLNGPKAKQVGLDYAIQAASGSMVLNGFPGGPPLKSTVPYIDCCTGTACAYGILLGLYHREKTGTGQNVDLSLFDIGCFTTQTLGTLLLNHVYNERRQRLANFGFSTYMSCLQAKDGMVMVVPSTDHIWARFAKALGREDLIADSRFKSDGDRWQHMDVLDAIVQKWAHKRTVSEIVETMRKARVACEAVRSSEQLMNDPQVAAREMVVWEDYPGLGRIPIPGLPIKLSDTPGRIMSPAPRLGEHNEVIYGGLLHLSLEEIKQLREERII